MAAPTPRSALWIALIALAAVAVASRVPQIGRAVYGTTR